MSTDKKALTLGAILYEGFELLDLYGPLEMFGNLKPQVEILTVAEGIGAVASFQGPQTIADFFDPEQFPGPRGLSAFPQANLEMALVADGVAPG